MPSPVGHALGGAIVGLLMERRHTPRALPLAVFAVVGMLPDLDFLWGRHNMETHSIGAAALAGLAVMAWTRGRNAWLGIAVTLAWSSHVFFDWLGSDDTPPLGVMALWPISSAFYFADAFVFEAISRRYWLAGFWRHNVWAVATEAAMLLPVLAALVVARRPRDRRAARD